MKQADVDWLH